MRPERTNLRLGFVPLSDCAPLVIAFEHGYFWDEGLDVTLIREASWANIRDKVAIGALDGAHMLAPMPLASTLGIAGPAKPMVTGCVLSLNGNAITVSTRLFTRMAELDSAAVAQRPCTAQALKAVIEEDRRSGLPPLTFASVFPVSTHNYQLRYWLASAGIDPDNDINLIVIPPAFVADNLASGRLDGYCVGEPWNSQAVAAGLGRSLITSYEIWNNGPEKVFGVTEEWADRYPLTHRAVVRALLRACAWLDDPDHRHTAAHLLCRPEYVNTPEPILTAGLTGQFRYSRYADPVPMEDFVVFHRYAANFPWRSQGLWFAEQMRRWGQLPREATVVGAVGRTYRPDVYRDAARALDMPVPEADTKVEGMHDREWQLREGGRTIVMGADRFFDGERFGGM